MSISVLLIGTGYDGPTEIPIQASSSIPDLFGAYSYERFLISSSSSASTTSVVLSSTPWNTELDAFYEYYYELLPYYLYNLALTGSTVTFSKIGENKEVVFKYLREAAETDISRAYYEANTVVTNLDNVYFMRVVGVKATTTIGTGSSQVILTSKYDGELYNNTSLTVSGSGSSLTLTIKPAANTGTSRTYSISAITSTQLAYEITLDYNKGYLPVYAEAVGTGYITGVSSALLTGGANGTITASGLTDLFERVDISAFGLVSVLGTPWSTTSSVITQTYLDEQRVPIMFVSSITAKTSSETSADYATALINNPVNIKDVSIVASECLYTPYPGVAYWASISVPYTILLSQSITPTPSWRGIGSIDIQPNYSSAYIESLASAGYVVATRNVPNNVAVYRATTTDSSWNTLSYFTYRQVCSDLYERLSPLIGENMVARSTINTIVNEVLANIPSIQDYSTVVDIYPGMVYVSVTIQVIGELKQISFQIGVTSDV